MLKRSIKSILRGCIWGSIKRFGGRRFPKVGRVLDTLFFNGGVSDVSDEQHTITQYAGAYTSLNGIDSRVNLNLVNLSGYRVGRMEINVRSTTDTEFVFHMGIGDFSNRSIDITPDGQWRRVTYYPADLVNGEFFQQLVLGRTTHIVPIGEEPPTVWFNGDISDCAVYDINGNLLDRWALNEYDGNSSGLPAYSHIVRKSIEFDAQGNIGEAGYYTNYTFSPDNSPWNNRNVYTDDLDISYIYYNLETDDLLGDGTLIPDGWVLDTFENDNWYVYHGVDSTNVDDPFTITDWVDVQNNNTPVDIDFVEGETVLLSSDTGTYINTTHVRGSTDGPQLIGKDYNLVYSPSLSGDVVIEESSLKGYDATGISIEHPNSGLNGVGYLEIADTASLDLSSQATIVFKSNAGGVKPTDTKCIVSKYDLDTNERSWSVEKNNSVNASDHHIQFLYGDVDGTFLGGVEFPTINHNVYNVITIDNGNIRAFPNGFETDVTTYTGSNLGSSLFDSNAPVLIGARNPSNVGNLWDAEIDDVIIFDRVLTDDEIKAYRNYKIIPSNAVWFEGKSVIFDGQYVTD